MTAITVTAENLTAALHAIRALRREAEGSGIFNLQDKLRRIEAVLTPVEPETLISDVPVYDTVLGWIAKNYPFTLDLMVDPIRETQRDGFWLSNQAKRRGIPLIKVKAPASVTVRYPEITHLNAYPVGLIEERMTGRAYRVAA